MSLARLLRGFIAEHRGAYAGAALMLLGIALINTWIPRQVGAIVDRLVAAQGSVLGDLALLAGAGLAVYGLRVGWRLTLFGAAYRLGLRLRVQLMQGLAQQAPRFFQVQRGGDLMALATNDVDAVEHRACRW